MENLKIDIVGMGIGSYHARGLAEVKGAVLNCICDPAPEVLEKAAKEFGVPKEKCFLSFDEMIKVSDADCVIVGSPDNFHSPQTIASLRAGKHVLCEKPITLHAEEAKAMIDAANETGKLLMVGQVCRVAPAFARVKKLIDSGEIGQVYFMESEYSHDYTYAKGYNNWRMDPKLKRHGVTGGGCHAVDLLRWYAGAEPEEVYAYGTHVAMPDWPCDESVIAIMRFNKDLTAKVYVNIGAKRTYTMRTVVYGTKGTIICDNTSSSFTLQKMVTDANGREFLEVSDVQVAVSSHNFRQEIEEFTGAIRSGAKAPINIEEGMKTVAVCEAIIKSTETHKPEAPVRY